MTLSGLRYVLMFVELIIAGVTILAGKSKHKGAICT